MKTQMIYWPLMIAIFGAGVEMMNGDVHGFSTGFRIFSLNQQDIGAHQAEDLSDVKALPFPPDVTDLEFDPVFKGVKFSSRSSLFSLAAFYRSGMVSRGWTEVEEDAEQDEDSIDMTFVRDGAHIEMKLYQYSDDVVRVSMDADGFGWEGTNDPAELVAAGIPQPRSYLYLQKNVALPDAIRDLRYRRDECFFKSDMTHQQSFDYFMKTITELGFKESRRPIITDDRRYTEFEQGLIKLSINIFAEEIGSRTTVEYKNSTPVELVAPLPAVASANMPARPGASGESDTEAEPDMLIAEKVSIEVSSNKGSAIVWYGSDKYEFKHVAAYHSDYYEWTMLIFADKPIPLQKLQKMLAENDQEFAFFYLYGDFDSPSYLTIQVDDQTRSDPDVSLSFSVPGVGIGGHTIENPEGEIKIDSGRATGTIKMSAEKILSKNLRFEASMDAGVIGPETELRGATPDAVPTPEPSFDSIGGLPIPKGATEVSRGGTRYRNYANTQVELPLLDVTDFYRKELTAQNWSEDLDLFEADAHTSTLVFKNDSGTFTVKLTKNGRGTIVELSSQDETAAKTDGIFPESGKARMIMGNAHAEDVVISIGKNNYTVKAGQGAKDPAEGLNFSISPGTYTVTIKIPGEKPQTEKLEIAAGTAWGVIALPTGAYIADQIF